MTTIRAIETRYAGCHFRSRLEARWAVFFDHLGIRWEYEPQGFQIFGDHYYLPDFYLPDTGTWVEVKGTFGPTELATIVNAVDYGGLPDTHESGHRLDGSGLLLLGPIPRVNHAGPDCPVPLHPLFTHREGVSIDWLTFTRSKPHLRVLPDGYHYWAADGSVEIPLPGQVDGRAAGFLDPRYIHDGLAFTERAYTAARSARFEHGQSGATE